MKKKPAVLPDAAEPSTLPSIAGQAPHRNPRPLLRNALIIAAYLFAFIVLDIATKQFERLPGIVAWYPPAGLTYTLLLIFGVGFAPAVAITLFISSLFIYRMPQPPYLLFLWACLSSLIYSLAAAFLRRRIRFDWQLRKLRDVTWLVVTAAFVSALLAILSVVSSALSSDMPRSEVLHAVFEWWIGETVGVLTITPFLLIFVMPLLKRFAEGQPLRPPARRSFPYPTPSAIGQTVSLALILYLIFGAPLLNKFYPLYLITLPIIWIALDHGLKGVSVGLVALNFGVVLALWFFRFDPAQIGELELLMIVTCIAGLLMGAVVTERKCAEEMLVKSMNDYQQLFDRANDVIVIFEPHNQIILAANAVACSMYGFDQDELVGMSLKELTRHAAQDEAHVRELLTGQPQNNFESIHFNRNGKDIHFLINCALIEYQGKKAVLSINRDISEREQTEIERQAILEIVQGLAFAKDMSEFLSLVHFSLGRVIKAENFFVALYNPASGLFEEVYTADQYDLPPHPSKREKSLTAYIFRTRAPFLLAEERFEQLIASGEVEKVGTSAPSFLGVPLIDSGNVIGVMAVQDYEKADVYSERDVQFMLSIAGQVALAVQRKQAEDTLQDAERKYRALVEQSPVVVYIDEVGGRWQYLSPQLEKVLGYTPEEFTNSLGQWKKNMHPDDIADVDLKTREGLENGQRIIVEYRIFARDGRLVWMHDEADVVHDLASGKVFLHGVFYDITERKQAEERIVSAEKLAQELLAASNQSRHALLSVVEDQKLTEEKLAASEAELRSLFAAMTDMVIVYDADGRYIKVAPTKFSSFYRPLDDILGKTVYDILPKEQADYIVAIIRESIQSGAAVKGEYALQLDGMEKWFSASASRLSESSAIWVARDITERKQAEEKLKNSEAFLNRLIEQSPLAMWISDDQGALIRLNQACCDLLNTTAEEVVGRYNIFEDNIVKEQGFMPQVKAVFENGETAHFELQYDSSKIEGLHFQRSVLLTLEVTIFPIKDTNNRITNAVIQHENITERKLAEQASRQYSEQLSVTVEIEHSLATSLDRELIYASLMKGIRRLFPDVATIFISNFDSEREMIQALRGLQDGEPVDVSQLPEIHLAPEGQGTQSRVIRSRQPLIINSDLKKASQNVTSVQVHGVDDGLDTQSAIYVPMLAQDKILGLIQCQSYSTDRFTEDDVRTLSLIANTAAVSIQNALLFEMSQTEIRERKQTETEQQALLDIMQGLAFSNDVGEFLPLVHSSLGRVVKAENFFVSLYDSSSGLFDGVYAVDQYDHPMWSPKQEKTLTSYIFRTKAPFLSTKERFEQLVASGEVEQIGTDSLSFLGVPLIASAQVIGVMVVQDYHQANVYSERDMRFMMSIAGQVALAVQRKLAEETLRASETQYRLLAEHMNDVIWLMDIKANKFIYVSPSVYKLRGYTSEEVISQPANESLTPESGEVVQRALMQSLQIIQEGKELIPMPMQIEQPCKNGSTVWTEVISNFIFDESGNPAQIIGQSRDITERKRAEEKLHASEQTLLNFIANSPDTIYVLDLKNHTNRYLNCEEFCGYPRSTLESPASIMFALHPDDIAIVQENWQQMLRASDEEVISCEYRLRRNDGVWEWIQQRMTILLRTADDKPVQVLVTLSIITERKRTEDEINRRIAELEMIYESGLALNQLLSPQEIGQKIIQQLEQKMDWHHTAIRLYHPQTESLKLLAYSHPGMEEEKEEERREIEERFNNTISKSGDGLTGWAFQNSQIIRSGNVSADPRYVATYPGIHSGLYVPMISNQNVIGVISIESREPNAFNEADERLVATLANQAAVAIENARLYQTAQQEIVERKRVETLLADEKNQLARRVDERTADLSIANSDLTRALRSRDEFLASMSHELRTPLTGILGFSEILQLNTYGELNEKQRKAVNIIDESGRHLLELISDILDLSKIEAGKLELQFMPCSIADVCQASLQLTKGMAQQKNQNIQYSPPPESVIVRADARRLKQILVNLLGNAVKFTPQGGELGLEIQTNASERKVRLTVWDKGIGIKSEDIHKLFKPFVQIDSSLAREYSGTGLGLSLVKRLVELHNGGIEVESVFGEGSRFTITLYWASQDTIPIPHKLHRDNGELSNSVTPPEYFKLPLVMFADDNELVLQMVADFLETKQYRVMKVRNGAELLESAAEFHPDILLVDIQMPHMDGLETIRRIRSHPEPLVAAAPVIVLTALVMPGDRETCLSAGANDYMSKPVRLKELAAAIQKLLEDKK